MELPPAKRAEELLRKAVQNMNRDLLELDSRVEVSVSSRHPEIVRLLVLEGARGGERLDYILDRVEPLRRAVGPLFARLRRRELLEQFDEEEYFLFLLMSAATPFALSALTGRVLGRDVGSEEHARRHAERIVRTLFGNA